MDTPLPLEPLYNVYLYDDDKNTQVYVAQTLGNVMELDSIIAVKLIREIEKVGRALVDSCTRREAITKRDLLISFGLKSEICEEDLKDLNEDN